MSTQLVNSKVNAEIREMLLGHKIGLASCYYRPSVEEMYEEYEKAIDNLTIDPSKRLQRKVETLTIEKSRLDILEAKFKQIEQQIVDNNRFNNHKVLFNITFYNYGTFE